ncbi:Peroxisome assembly protein [Phytophthora palmivora]|uniref:RING-type E3 ubiquitin transferase n=1 Tax=Phytophthora palmivora TaxID=4796 RepID=A0A2P4YCI8_9STRA|nr:Peroxisome assembly protein [Phytophthora palmivora]
MTPQAADTFPAAGACAELLLAENKDAVYESEVKNLLREVLERCCGAHLLSQLLPELSVLSSLLYHALSIGSQQPGQTLGEEFCDIIRVTKPRSGPVKPSGWKNLSQLTRTPRERMEQQLRLRQEAAAAATNGSDGASPTEDRVAMLHPQRLFQQLDRAVSKLKAMSAWIENDVFPASYEFSLACVQQWGAHAHLAAFYVFARYLHVAKRIANIQYVFVRKDLMPGMNLSLLGYMMSIRLFATAIIELKRLRGCYKQEKKQRQQEARAAAGIPATPFAQSERKNKAECPLCRQETHPQQIKCVYNYV